jgi:hypothetical protein
LVNATVSPSNNLLAQDSAALGSFMRWQQKKMQCIHVLRGDRQKLVPNQTATRVPTVCRGQLWLRMGPVDSKDFKNIGIVCHDT